MSAKGERNPPDVYFINVVNPNVTSPDVVFFMRPKIFSVKDTT